MQLENHFAYQVLAGFVKTLDCIVLAILFGNTYLIIFYAFIFDHSSLISLLENHAYDSFF